MKLPLVAASSLVMCFSSHWEGCCWCGFVRPTETIYVTFKKTPNSVSSLSFPHAPQCCMWRRCAVPSPSVTCSTEPLSALTCCTPSAQHSPKCWSVPVFLCVFALSQVSEPSRTYMLNHLLKPYSDALGLNYVGVLGPRYRHAGLVFSCIQHSGNKILHQTKESHYCEFYKM